jgi:hypothetical protein
MSMDRVEEMVRDELRRLASAPQPDPDRMLARVRRRTQRFRITLAAAIATLLAAGGGAAVVASRPGPPPPGIDLPFTGVAYFLTPEKGFALLRNCDTGLPTCALWIASTTDGGQSWRQQKDAGFGMAAGQPAAFELYAFDERRLVIDGQWGREPTKRWYSSDGGASWRQIEHEFGSGPATEVGEIPPGSVVGFGFPGLHSGPVLPVLNPDGTRSSLRMSRPGYQGLRGFRSGMTDGSLWAFGGGARDPYLAVSRDQGRTWRDLPLPAGVSPVDSLPFQFDSWDGRAGYLNIAERLWRTVDGGEHWQSIAPPRSDSAEYYNFVACPGGGLLMGADTGGTHLLPRSADAFDGEPVTPSNFVRRIGARILATGDDGTFTTTDCRTWTRLGS